MRSRHFIETAQRRTIIVGLFAFLAIGVFVERWEPLRPLQHALQRTSVPSATLSSDMAGRALRQSGLLHVVPNEFTDYPIRQPKAFESRRTGSENFLFQKKSRVGIQLYGVTPPTPEELPSSAIVHPDLLHAEAPTLSIATDKPALYDPELGLITHAGLRGRSWERPAFLSYFEGKSLVFATGVGLRIHGDHSRRHDKKSFRVYFNDIYGADQFLPGVLFGPRSEPIKELIVHNDLRLGMASHWHLINPLAYDISRKIGCLTVDTKPVRFFLNGVFQGVYVLKEFLNQNYLISHFGHAQFNFIRTKQGGSVRPSHKSGNKQHYEEFRDWALADTPVTLEEVAARVDIENLSFWMLSMMFCAPTDAHQGPMLLDETRPDAKWFWINWDMDHAFRNTYHQPKLDAWHYNVLEWRGTVDERGSLFNRLRKDSPAYRRYFTQLFVEAMNHKLTDEFLHERVDYYQQIAESYGIEHRSGFQKFRDFVTYRKPVLRQQMQEHFSLGESFVCTILGPAGAEFEIDGYRHRSGYVGWYFDGMPLSVNLMAPLKRHFSHWLVNGRKVEADDDLRLSVHADTIVEAIFHEN